MEKQTIIITGASRGLGAAAARISAEMGANVVLNARSADDLSGVAYYIRETGSEAITVAGDVSEWNVCEQLVEKAVERFGAVHALVNNAAVLAPINPIADSEVEAWLYNLQVNLYAPFLLTRAALPHLREQQGRIINVSSGAAINPTAGWSAYCSTKAGLNQFTSVLALEEPRVTALSFRPGIVDTEMQGEIRRSGATGMPPEEHRRFVSYYEQGELQPPERPGRALAALALAAPHEWSGEFISWQEERVQRLIAATEKRLAGRGEGEATGPVSEQATGE